MTQERARYLLDNRLLGGCFKQAYKDQYGYNKVYADGITEAEDKVIRDKWRTMPGNTCYTDAVVRIAQNR